MNVIRKRINLSIFNSQSCIIRNVLKIRTITTTTYSSEEAEKFRKLSSAWWDKDGEFKALHSMNKLRVRFIRDGIISHFQSYKYSSEFEGPTPLKDLNILDIGSGGGILSEPLARLGARVKGIDPVQENIGIAQSHISDNLKSFLSYECSTIEDFAKVNLETKFDAIVASEVIEHVIDPNLFIKTISELLKPFGCVFLTTLNRNAISWLGAIVAAEYLLGIVPKGTHDFNKFISPEELQKILTINGFKTKSIHGVCYNSFNNNWSWARYPYINYFLSAYKL